MLFKFVPTLVWLAAFSSLCETSSARLERDQHQAAEVASLSRLLPISHSPEENVEISRRAVLRQTNGFRRSRRGHRRRDDSDDSESPASSTLPTAAPAVQTNPSTLVLFSSESPPSSASASSSAAVPGPSSCFPSLGQNVPIPSSKATNESLSSWWCDERQEYAFLGKDSRCKKLGRKCVLDSLGGGFTTTGFSYDVSGCQSVADLTKDFKQMRGQFNARYVRLYGACDNKVRTLATLA
jgi:hypothetical protein